MEDLSFLEWMSVNGLSCASDNPGVFALFVYLGYPSCDMNCPNGGQSGSEKWSFWNEEERPSREQ